MQDEEKNIAASSLYQPTDADYEKAEMDLLRDALKRTYTERFKMMTTLMKMNIMLRRAKITHQPMFDMNDTK